MKALMVVDMQNGQIRENNKHIVKRINDLLKKEKFDKVFLHVFTITRRALL